MFIHLIFWILGSDFGSGFWVKVWVKVWVRVFLCVWRSFIDAGGFACVTLPVIMVIAPASAYAPVPDSG